MISVVTGRALELGKNGDVDVTLVHARQLEDKFVAEGWGVTAATFGCWTDNGPPADPNVRPFIERFFHLIARHFAHRLPGTVGSSPDSIERALSDPKGNVRLSVELPELEDMIHVLLANYNATSHSGVGGKTPLEAMAYSVKARRGFLRTLPMPVRCNLCLMQEARVVTNTEK